MERQAFSITPEDLTRARELSQVMQLDHATKLVWDHVNTRLKTIRDELLAGKEPPTPIVHIRIDKGVTGQSPAHLNACKAITQQLIDAGFKAKHRTEPPTDGFGVYTEYISIVM